MIGRHRAEQRAANAALPSAEEDSAMWKLWNLFTRRESDA
jgi:hypothetical protein